VCGGYDLKRVFRVDVIEVMNVWICGGKRVSVGGAAFSLFVDCVESWLEGLAFVSCVCGEEIG